MTIVDLRAKGFTVSVGGLDCTPIAVSLDLKANQAILDRSGLLGWDGTLELGGYPIAGFSESLDPRVNPSRWAPGTVVSVGVVYSSGTVALPIRLRILRSPQPPYPQSPNLVILVGDDTKLLNYRQPEGDESGVTLGTETTRTTVINSLLTAANASALTTAIAEYPLLAPVQKLGTEGFIRQAGGFAAAVGRVMYQQANGDFVAPAINLTPSAFKVFTVGDNEADYFPLEGDVPPATIRVTGTTFNVEENVANPPPITTEVRDPDEGNILVEDTRTTITGKGTNTFSIEERRREQAQLVFEELEGDTSMIVSRREVKTFNYSTLPENRGRLLTEVIRVFEPRGVTQPAEFPNDTTEDEATRTTITYLYNADFVVNEKRTITQEQNGVINKVSSLSSNLVKTQLVNGERVFEYWQATGGGDYLYTVTGRTFGNNRKNTNRSGSEPGVKPEATQFRDPENYSEGSEVEGTASFAPLAGDEFRGVPSPIVFPEGTLVSDAQAAEMALLYGKILQGARWPVRWVGELSSDWLSAFNPLARIDFVQGGIRRAYLVNGLAISLLPDSAAISGEGIELGTVDGMGNITPPYTVL